MEYILGKKIYFRWCVTTTQVLPDLRILIIYVREHFVTNVLSAIRLIGPNRLPNKINFKLFNLGIELNITFMGQQVTVHLLNYFIINRFEMNKTKIACQVYTVQ